MEYVVAGWNKSTEQAGPAFYWMGNETLKVPRSMHKTNRERLVMLMGKKAEKSVAFVASGVSSERNDSDHEPIFRQESNFHYLFGVAEPDCLGAVDTRNGAATLFVPRLSEDYATFMGPLATPADFKKKYEVEDVRYVEEIGAFMAELQPETVYLYSGINSDSKAEGKPAIFEGIENYKTDLEVLHGAVYEARVIKNQEELRLMRYVNEQSSRAHIAVMRRVSSHIPEAPSVCFRF